MNNLAAVVIPIYTEKLRYNEGNAIEQVIKVLGNYDIYFIMPESLEFDYGNPLIREKRFEDEHFSSRQAYSSFMLEEKLYREFRMYEYILIYQLDAFVFEDRLTEFCKKGWDYVGAPWTHGACYFANGCATWYVGNGGFSLRKTESFLTWLDKKKEDICFAKEYLPEDIIIAAYNDGLAIPPKEDAVAFAFEMDFDTCMELNGGKLPFGCHAWEHYEYEKWKVVIEELGYTVCDLGMERKKAVNYEVLKQVNAEWEQFKLPLYLEHLGSSEEFDKGIIIYGLGSQGFRLYQMLRFWNIDIIAGVDNYMPEHRRKLWPIKIISDSQTEKYPSIPVIISMNEYEEVENEFISRGYKKNRDLYIFNEMIDFILGKLREIV